MSLDRITVSDNGRFLRTSDGMPFFWLADTAWELFHRLSKEEAKKYLDVRRDQGFNVIQAAVLGELDGLRVPNAYGHLPLCGDDPARPNEFYFRHVDEVIRLAASNSMYIALLPVWGDKVHAGLWGIGPVIFDPDNAKTYGRYLGDRYREDTNILWVLGGDRPGAGYESLWKNMADGISEGLGHKPFFTYHPWGGLSDISRPWSGCSSSEWFHECEWLGMNMWQSGHVVPDAPNWEMIKADYDRVPIKPVLDSEPNYEGHPVDPFLRKWKPEFGRFGEHDVRKQAYRSVFAGACGHSYGHHSIWQFWSGKFIPVNFPMSEWEEALYAPGASQMIHLKNLLLSRAYFDRIPASEMLPDLPTLPPVDNTEHFDPLRASHPVATRNSNGDFGMVYFPQSNQKVKVNVHTLAAELHAWWHDPRNGKSYDAGTYSGRSLLEFVSPPAGPDWILVLDDATKKYPVPGGIRPHKHIF